MDIESADGDHAGYEAAAAAPPGADVMLSELYRSHAVGLMRLATVLVGDGATAEDVVQDVFVGLFRRWSRLREPGAAASYLRTGVVNRCRSVLRRRAVAARFGAGYEPPVWSAEAAALIGEERRELLAAVAALPARQREVLALRYFCELSDQEIARMLRVSRGTVSSTASRALGALARALGEGS